jgi:hypothetical protein
MIRRGYWIARSSRAMTATVDGGMYADMQERAKQNNLILAEKWQ